MQLQNATNLFSSHRSVCCRSLRTQVDFSWFFLSAMFSSHSLIWRRTAVCSYFSTRLSRTMCIDFLVCKRQITTARSKKKQKASRPPSWIGACVLRTCASVSECTPSLGKFSPFSIFTSCSLWHREWCWMSGDCLVSSSQNKWKQRHIYTYTNRVRRIRKNGTHESANDTQAKSVVDYIQDIQHTHFPLSPSVYLKRFQWTHTLWKWIKAKYQKEKITKRKLERSFVHTRDINSKWKRNWLSVFPLIFVCYQLVNEWNLLKLVRNRENSVIRTTENSLKSKQIWIHSRQCNSSNNRRPKSHRPASRPWPNSRNRNYTI